MVKTVEFISWNSRKQKFDFGVIEGMGDKPEVKMLDGSRCFSCHKNRGPILGVTPWSNTAHNDLIRSTSTALFKFPAQIEKDANGNMKTTPRDDIDGLKPLKPSGPEVDAAVRQGADVLRDRERFKLLVRTADGRKVLVMLLGGVVAQGDLEAIDKKLKIEINNYNIIKFLQDAHNANKTLAPSTLADFSPAGPLNKPILTQSPDGQVNQVTRYDAIRAAGNHGLLTQHQPSNPKAFIRPPTFTPRNNSDLVNVVMLARAIGLSEDDRSFLVTTLREAAETINSPRYPAARLARAVFTGPKFADVLKSGVLPERDDFKDLFVAGLLDAMRVPTTIERFWRPRDSYATAPKFDPNAPPEKEVVVLPSHSCLACHDVRGPGKPPAFSPIPMLPFDPFDKVSRETWLKTADRKQKVQFLSRLEKRLTTDKDMPPEDSTEYEMFRVKNPDALNAVRDWLDTELKNLKAN